jgi:hypothetical protein
LSSPKQRFLRKIIKITAEDSPNVQYAKAQMAAGLEPTGEIIVPGVLPWQDYVKRRKLWDKVRQTIGLDAEFWEGAEFLLFPPDWLNRAEKIARDLQGVARFAKAIGIDTGEGSSKTSMSAVDEKGLIEQDSRLTQNTSVIIPNLIAFASRFGVPPSNWIFDRGGGGKIYYDSLRGMGYPVRTVAFGAAVTKDDWKKRTKEAERLYQKEDSYVYLNRRAQMYGELRMYMNPLNYQGFSIPEEYQELRRQLSLMPLMFDQEGRMKMLPKNKRSANSTELSLSDLLGCSPDESDSLVLAVHGMLHKPERIRVGAMWGDD